MVTKGVLSLLVIIVAFFATPSVTAAEPVTPSAARNADTPMKRYIVFLQGPPSSERNLTPTQIAEQRRRIASTNINFANSVSDDVVVLRQFQTVPAVVANLTETGFRQLSNNSDVISIMEDTPMPMLPEATPSLGTSSINPLQIIRADKAHSKGYNGTGMTIVIMDSGVDPDHPFFGGRVIDEACFSSDCPNRREAMLGPGSGIPCPWLGCDHGTHVAGIAAGDGSQLNGPGRGLMGVAPAAKIISIQIFSKPRNPFELPGSKPSDQLHALELISTTLRYKYNISSINLSIGSVQPFTLHCRSEEYQQAFRSRVDDFIDAGIAVVVAAGNSQAAPTSYGIAQPACIPGVVSVAATSDDDKISSYSYAAGFVSLLAPGDKIRSSVLGDAFDSKSGTSMAAPYVSGAWAIFKQAQPLAEHGLILDLVKYTGKMVKVERPPNPSFYRPRLDIAQALNYPDIFPAEEIFPLASFAPRSAAPTASSVPSLRTARSARELRELHELVQLASSELSQ